MLATLKRIVSTRWRRRKLAALYRKYAEFTMIPGDNFVNNLELAMQARRVPGGVVECGVWRGGMIAAMAEVLGPDREYVLCDSFEGLPPAQPIDGAGALAWQQNTTGPHYHDNCTASQASAERAMRQSPARAPRYLAGWFEETLPLLEMEQPIAVLRLDADWYESTLTCLNHLYDRLAPGGLLIIDDYYTWDGCSRAVHDFLSSRQLELRVRQWNNDVCYLQQPALHNSPRTSPQVELCA